MNNDLFINTLKEEYKWCWNILSSTCYKRTNKSYDDDSFQIMIIAIEKNMDMTYTAKEILLGDFTSRSKNVAKKYVRVIVDRALYHEVSKGYKKGLTRRERVEYKTLDKNSDRYRQLSIRIVPDRFKDIDEIGIGVKCNRLYDILSILTEDEFSIIRDFYFYGYSEREIGLNLNISKQAVNKRRKNILNKLKQGDELKCI